jgi:uncharacterized membrane protein (DUF106 family)
VNKSKKIALVLLITLFTVLTLSTFVSSVNAQGTVSFQTSISTNNNGVGSDAKNTFTINNTGTAQLGDINVTIPDGSGGYTNLRNFAIVQSPASQSWTISRIDNSIVLYGSSMGLNPGQSIMFSFDAKNPVAVGNYKWIIGGNVSTSTDGLNVPAYKMDVTSSVIITSVMAASIIFGIAAGIAILNSGINRVLVNYFVGWEQYRIMQKEMAEYRSETMAAAKSKDKKQMEKLKKRQSQINSMQAKMMKPQMVQFGISFLYIFVWFFVLTPTYGNTSLVYFTLPGFGALPVIYWYPICSFFLGLLSSRILGIMPIEP